MRPPCSRGPIGRTSCARERTKQIVWSRFQRGHDGRYQSKASSGPLCCGEDRRSGPQGGRKGLRPLAAAPGMARRQARPGRTDFSSMDGRKTQRRVAFFLVTSLWPCKERLPVRPGGGRNKTGTSTYGSKYTNPKPIPDRAARVRNDEPSRRCHSGAAHAQRGRNPESVIGRHSQYKKHGRFTVTIWRFMPD